MGSFLSEVVIHIATPRVSVPHGLLISRFQLNSRVGDFIQNSTLQKQKKLAEVWVKSSSGKACV